MTLSKSDVMRSAWAEYRSMNARPAHETRGYDISFSGCLKWAWKLHKQAAANLAEEARIASNAQARAVQQAIDELQFKSFRYDIGAERRALEAKRDAAIAA